MKPIIYKDFEPIIKDVDTKKGIVEGYFSTWGIVDAHGDEIMPGAYRKSILENGPNSTKPRIYHLWGHDTTKPLGRFTENWALEEDQKGLFFRSKISQTSYGRDVLLLYQDGVINEHSVGISVIKSENASEGHTRLTELKLYEGSTVTFGANAETPTVSVKDMEPQDLAEKLSGRIDVLTKSLHTGTYTDDTFVLLEMNLRQIQGHYVSLVKSIQPGPPTGGDGKPDEKVNLDDFLNQLKL